MPLKAEYSAVQQKMAGIALHAYSRQFE